MQSNRTTKGYRIDMKGRVFGRLTVLEYSHSTGYGAFWKCKCECGKEHTVSGVMLRIGNTLSCGCYGKEVANTAVTKHGEASKRTPEYRVWCSMRSRCNNQSHQDYDDYGGRGITICSEWEDFAAFLADMGRRPSMKHTLDRIDVNGNYEPGNCRWATWREQAQNKRNNVWITHDGKTLCVREWERQLGLNVGGIQSRLLNGWSEEESIATPSDKRKSKLYRSDGTITFNGETLHASEWAERYGLSAETVKSRLRRGWAIDEMLFSPASKKKRHVWIDKQDERGTF